MKTRRQVSNRQDLLYLLSHAAEIEHSLCCQYLFAAFSLKQQGDPEVTDDQAAVIAGWRGKLISIATEEMLHLGLVSNLVSAIGGAPNFHKTNFPQSRSYSPIRLDFRLAPASRETIRRFACFELPPELAADSIYRAWPVNGHERIDWVESCQCIKGEDAHRDSNNPQSLLPAFFDYTSIGELYQLIEQGFKTLYPEDESALFIGPPGAQTADMWKDLIAVKDRASAVEAIDTIMREGEGAYGDDAAIACSHFGRFVEIWAQFTEGQGGEAPARNVVENPVLALHHDITGPAVVGSKPQPWKQPTLITAPIARQANEIFVSIYELALHVLQRYFADAGESEEQRYILKQTFLSLMRFCIAPLGTAITYLPAYADEQDGERAGASYELFSNISLLPQLSAAWRYFSERLEQLSEAATKLSQDELAAPYPRLRQAFTGVVDAPALPGIARVCEQYSTLIKVGLKPPDVWSWENGIRCFFSPLDVLRMGSWIVSEESVRTNIEQIVLRITGTGGVTTMPPPYQLGDSRVPSNYPNPEGSWTSDRIATFIDWAAQRPSAQNITYNNNPTWFNAVKDMFNAGDIKCMKRMANLDLGEYEKVAARAEEIYEQVKSGSMPPSQPWSDEKVACFKLWIEGGKNQGDPPIIRYDWAPTGAPLASSRYDDIWFIDEETGWAINSNGHILHTTDGGDHWVQQFQSPLVNGSAVYLRCIAFANPKRGWVGTFNQQHLLYETHDGETWSAVEGLPHDAPVKACGISVVNKNVIYLSGTNEPEDHARVMKTTDGGKSWIVFDMAEHATLLVDCHFWDENSGVVVGGLNRSGAADPGRDDVKPVILFTQDGGQTWEDRLANTADNYPLGEWGWKIQFINDTHGFISLESFRQGAIAKTSDGGKTWTRLDVNDAQHNVNLEGIGFIDEARGWVGGWGNMTGRAGFTSATTDGGHSWTNANEVGLFLNRFRFFGNPVKIGYASGVTVNKLVVHDGAKPPPRKALRVATPRMLSPAAPENFNDTLAIPVLLPAGLSRSTLHVWDHFGRQIRTLLDEKNPRPGPRIVIWDGLNDDGHREGSGIYIYRLTTDHDAESGSARHLGEE